MMSYFQDGDLDLCLPLAALRQLPASR